MDTNTLLFIAFIIYIMVMVMSYLFKIRWLMMIAGLLWFIPITQIGDMWVIIVSSTMIIVHGILGFYEKNESWD
jgi:hypothetical protein